MQSLFSFSIAIYLAFYVFEGLIRYDLHLAGADTLIFIRDAVLIVPLATLFVYQLLHRRLHPAYGIFIFVTLLHGLVMLLNIGSLMAVLYATKMLMTVLAGGLAASTLFRPGRHMLLFIFLLWSISWAGVMLDKYYIDVPWTGMETNIGDIQVDISRDWQITGEEKRAGGFTRSSIHAATIEPLLAIILMFNLRFLPLRLLVALLTVPALVWTTQKGPIVAYLLTLGFLTLMPKRPIPILKTGVLLMLTLAVALPVVLPGYTMPAAEGVFSFSSFYLRVEDMWPHAWQWIDRHEAFPFGVGLGGISGAQRLYALSDLNAADNVFILMYAYFGVMSLFYLGCIGAVTLHTPGNGSKTAAQALATLLFLFAYGCVISLLEDQMASLFLGAAFATLYYEKRQNPFPFLPGSRKTQALMLAQRELWEVKAKRIPQGSGTA